MNERRRKAKEKTVSQSKTAINVEKQSEIEERRANKRARLDRLGAYLVDVSKFIITGVVITSVYKEFSDSDSHIAVYVSIAFALVILAAGIRLTYKK